MRRAVPTEGMSPRPCPYLTLSKHNCRHRALEHNVQAKFQQVLEILTAHQGHQELWNRRRFPTLCLILNNCTCLPFGPVVGDSQARSNDISHG